MKKKLAILLLVPFWGLSQITHTDVKIESTDVTLAATLCAPAKTTNIAFLIIAGSGPTDRNCNSPMLKTNAFLQLADSLAAHGYASLRYDKRGIGESVMPNMKEEDMRFEQGVQDAEACMAWLKKQGYTQVIIAGHSEGSLVGMLAAKKGAAAFVSISGISVPAHVLLKEQLGKQIQGEIYTQIAAQLDSLAAGMEVTNNNPMLQSLFRKSVQPYLISWMAYDPCVEIAKLTMPVGVISGEKDIQVDISEVDKLAKCARSEGLKIKFMTHTLKRISTDTEQNKTYTDPTMPLHNELVTALVKFAERLD